MPSARTTTPSRPCTRRSGRAGRCSTCPRGVKVEAPLFSLVGLAGKGRVDFDHTLISGGRGRGDAGPRDGRARPGRGPGPARRGGRAVRRPGGAAPVRQHPELGRRHLALQPRAGPGRARRRDPVDRRRARVAAGEGQPGGRADGAGGLGAGQRRDVHHRPAAPGLLHPPGPRRPAHPQRPALQGRPEGPLADRLEGDDPRREGRAADRRLPEERQPRSSPTPPAPTRSPAWRSRPTTSAAPTAPPPAGSTRR